ncbi:MAG TPA: hypothetical protein VMA54_06360 [Steroidobacteraceae bacterium]|nr:hypothetical protein [Steroidobacteraceae bacterium]HUA23718.1 hypothetical protein [Steroidobacteraceae bacterium]
MTKDATIKAAIAAVQKQIDGIIEQYATSGPAVVHPAKHPDHSALIQAITARNLLKHELS